MSTALSAVEPPCELLVSVGGGVGGAAPPTGGRQPGISVSDRRDGCGDDLCEAGGVVDGFAVAEEVPGEGALESRISFSIATICLP
jgi:hypothetical protein